MQQLSGATPAEPQDKNIFPQGPTEWKEPLVASQKKSILPVDATDKNKSLFAVGKSEDQHLVPSSQHPTSISAISQPSPASQPPKSEPLKENKGSAISQTSAEIALSALPASVENITAVQAKSPTVQKQEEMKPANIAPNAQPVKPPSALEKADTDLSKLQKVCTFCKEILKEDYPNYNICDSCKVIVCNHCGGLNSRAGITEVRKYPTKYKLNY